MKSRFAMFVLLVFSVVSLFSACALDNQKAKERMAFNNFMEDMKGTQMMEGKIGNIKYTGNSITFDFLDTSMSQDEMEILLGKTMAYYVNRNNRAETGITVLKATGSVSGKPVVRAVYQAGPAATLEDLIKFVWLD